ncbi:Utp14 domain-containing protein [Trichoderma sp. TUCIM 5745]
MPGRQAHGRSLLAQPKAKAGPKKSKSRAQTNALNAFNIAQERFPTKDKRTPRARELDAEIEKKHGREEDDEDEEEEEEGPKRKKAKAPRGAATDGEVEFGSDSEGNEWQLGGMADDDDDSEIESDDAFGDSDNEMFQGYAFRGSKTGQRKDDDSEDSDDGNDDQGETLGEDAIDLATALDQFEEESEEEPEGEEEEEEDSESGEEDSDDSDEFEGLDDSDEEADPAKLEQLKGLISGFGGEDDDGEKDVVASGQQKIDLGDLGLSGLNDPFMKQSKRPASTKKLEVPLSRREQGRIDRSAAYEKTNETLDRWTETVKQNRRAEHLVFPLPQNSESAGLDRTELQPLSLKSASNELEATIMGIMEQSGLSLEKEKKPKKQEFDEEGNLLTRKQALEKKRIERELASREAKRAARIKKIKSKAYHRVHRKQKERDEMATREAMAEAGEIDSEEEREAQDRRRALERVGQRHKDSKWAKMGSKAKRAVWDDDFRAGLTEMARKDEDLRRRKEGKSSRGDGDDSDETSSSGSDDDDDGDNADLLRQLDELEKEESGPQSKLMKMKFMQKAEAAKKKANDDLIKEIRKELDGEDAQGSDDDEEEKGGQVGRRQYGSGAANPFSMPQNSTRASRKKLARDEDEEDNNNNTGFTNGDGAPHISNGAISHAWSTTPAETTTSIAGAWSKGESRNKKKSARADDLDLNANILTASQPSSKKTKQPQDEESESESDSDSDSDIRLPMAIRDKALIARAFAGEDVVAEFQREKDEIAEADDDKVIDNTLPGWGSWVGDGVSSREKKRHQGRFLTKVEGINKKDRKDAKLDKVIINEKRIKKNDRYLAAQLPFPFESQQQYERSLRLPVGPEWMTKETFQASTKPRVIMKQGIITPMSKPNA